MRSGDLPLIFVLSALYFVKAVKLQTAPPAPCIDSIADLPMGDIVREDGNEQTCRSSNGLELTGRRLATDSFFTP